MNQIIIETIALPETSRDRYACPELPLVVELDMISGRRVGEIRGGHVWKPQYSYDYMGDEIVRPLLKILRSGKAFSAAVLPDNGNELVVSTFRVESLTNPTFAFSKSGKAMWHNLAFTLREVNPHD